MTFLYINHIYLQLILIKLSTYIAVSNESYVNESVTMNALDLHESHV